MATSPTTSRLRRRPPPPVVVRVSAPMAAAVEMLVACQAGARPNSTPIVSAAAAQNATTRRSKARVTVAGRSPGGISAGAASKNERRQSRCRARRRSATGPRLSVSSWRMIRRRPAPSAARTASSRVLALARAISRFATLAQQISSTNPTTPRNSIDVTLRSLPIIVSCIGSSRTPRPLLVCGNSRGESGRQPPTDRTARRRCRRPGFIRPTTCSMYCPRTRGGMLTNGRIAHTLVRPRISKVFGTTPTTVHRIPSILISCPTMAGSRLKRDSHNVSLITMTLAALLFVLGEERAAGDRL